MAKKQKRSLDKACVYCECASALRDDDFMLCTRHGVVSAGHKCRHFSYDPLKRIPVPRKTVTLEAELPELP